MFPMGLDLFNAVVPHILAVKSFFVPVYGKLNSLIKRQLGMPVVQHMICFGHVQAQQGVFVHGTGYGGIYHAAFAVIRHTFLYYFPYGAVGFNFGAKVKAGAVSHRVLNQFFTHFQIPGKGYHHVFPRAGGLRAADFDGFSFFDGVFGVHAAFRQARGL